MPQTNPPFLQGKPKNGQPGIRVSPGTLPPTALKPNGQASKLLDRIRDTLRTLHYSPRTEEAYVDWIYRYIVFHHKRHPAEMGAQEINEFLTYQELLGHNDVSTTMIYTHVLNN